MFQTKSENISEVNFFYRHKLKVPFKKDLFEQKAIYLISVIGKNEHKTLREINVSFCSDKQILRYNSKFLSHNYYTDIITFSYPEKKYIDSDIVISLDSVKNNANSYGISFRKELFRVMIHGILHLCGYNDIDKRDKLIMKKKEDHYLNYLKQKKQKIIKLDEQIFSNS